MANRFRFLNVGQGLYYSGKLDCGFNFVFDCGSESYNHDHYIENCIINEYKVDEQVDILFWSHLHEDHINGLNLLKKHVYIGRIIMPYLGTDSIFINTFFYIITNGDEELSNYLIGQYRETRYEEDDFNCMSYVYNYNEWVFKCVSKKQDPNTINALIADIKKEVASYYKTSDIDVDLDTITSYLTSNGYEKIKEIYRRYFGDDLNDTSMCLLHHPANCFWRYTLLTGDAEFDQGMINEINHYTGYRRISYFQVPHHGAKSNWNKLRGLENYCDYFYISCGREKKYSHPSSEVINGINKLNRPPFISTESECPYFWWCEYYIY